MYELKLPRWAPKTFDEHNLVVGFMKICLQWEYGNRLGHEN